MEVVLFEEGIIALGALFLVLPFVGAGFAGYSRATRRERVATTMMHALLTQSPGLGHVTSTRETARSAVAVADRLIAELDAPARAESEVA